MGLSQVWNPAGNRKMTGRLPPFNTEPMMLLHLARAYGQETGDGIRIELKLSQRVLGEMLGASRESINKQLQAWSGQGLLRFERGSVVLLRPEALGGILGVH